MCERCPGSGLVLAMGNPPPKVKLCALLYIGVPTVLASIGDAPGEQAAGPLAVALRLGATTGIGMQGRLWIEEHGKPATRRD
jgi:hypothetical protein